MVMIRKSHQEAIQDCLDFIAQDREQIRELTEVVKNLHRRVALLERTVNK